MSTSSSRSRSQLCLSAPKVPLWMPISRVNQLDAAQVDERNLSKLKDQLKSVFSLYPGFFFKFEPEIEACIRFCIWRFSICIDKPTPGSALKGLRYRDERAFQVLLKSGKVRTGLEGPGLTFFQKFGFFVMMVALPYALARFQLYSTSNEIVHNQQNTLLNHMLINSRKMYTAANLINTVVFLNTGRYHGIIERVLNARLVYQKPNIVNAMNSDALNRQLVWGEFLELLLILLPFMKRITSWPFSRRQSRDIIMDKDACPLCAAKPIIIPYVAEPCGHQYCYYCLKTRCISNRTFCCVTCNTEIKNMLHVLKKH